MRKGNYFVDKLPDRDKLLYSCQKESIWKAQIGDAVFTLIDYYIHFDDLSSWLFTYVWQNKNSDRSLPESKNK
jgi:hypothetical protein